MLSSNKFIKNLSVLVLVCGLSSLSHAGIGIIGEKTKIIPKRVARIAKVGGGACLVGSLALAASMPLIMLIPSEEREIKTVAIGGGVVLDAPAPQLNQAPRLTPELIARLQLSPEQVSSYIADLPILDAIAENMQAHFHADEAELIDKAWRNGQADLALPTVATVELISQHMIATVAQAGAAE